MILLSRCIEAWLESALWVVKLKVDRLTVFLNQLQRLESTCIDAAHFDSCKVQRQRLFALIIMMRSYLVSVEYEIESDYRLSKNAFLLVAASTISFIAFSNYEWHFQQSQFNKTNFNDLSKRIIHFDWSSQYVQWCNYNWSFEMSDESEWANDRHEQRDFSLQHFQRNYYLSRVNVR